MEKIYKNRRIMSTFSQIKQIHTLKNVLGLEDDLYRDMLASFGVCSSKNLTTTEAQIFIEILNDKISGANLSCYKKYDDLNGRDSIMATPRQLRKLEVSWADITDERTEAGIKKSLREFVKKQFHVDDIRFMTKSKASRIIAVLEKIKVNQCVKAI